MNWIRSFGLTEITARMALVSMYDANLGHVGSKRAEMDEVPLPEPAVRWMRTPAMVPLCR